MKLLKDGTRVTILMGFKDFPTNSRAYIYRNRDCSILGRSYKLISKKGIVSRFYVKQGFRFEVCTLTKQERLNLKWIK